MKHNNPSMGDMVTECSKPKMKDLKIQLESANEARDIIEDLYENNYLPYNISDTIRGTILIRIREIEEMITKRKKEK